MKRYTQNERIADVAGVIKISPYDSCKDDYIRKYTIADVLRTLLSVSLSPGIHSPGEGEKTLTSAIRNYLYSCGRFCGRHYKSISNNKF